MDCNKCFFFLYIPTDICSLENPLAEFHWCEWKQ